MTTAARDMRQPNRPTIKVLKTETLYAGRIIRLIREQLEVEGHRFVRETIKHPGAIVVVPVLDDGRIVFVRQYRRSIDRWLLELPAGTLDHRESKAACARRELEEEAGWTAARVKPIGRFYAAPGFVSEQLTLFLATGLTAVPARPEPDELVHPELLSLSQALAKIRSGDLCDAKSMVGLFLAQPFLRR